MANDVGNVALAVDGGIYVGAVGATAPTSSEFVPTSNGYEHWGYYSQEGATLTPVPGAETTLPAHNGDIVYDEQEPGWWTFAFGALEFKKKAVAEGFFDAAIDDGDGSVTVTTAAVTTYRSLIAIAINKDGSQTLQHYPRVKISERQGIVFNRTTLVTLGATFKTYKDQSLEYHFKAFDPAWVLTPAVPALTAATPSAAVEGAMVKITGSGFFKNGAADVSGAASVKFGATNATGYMVDDDNTIYALMPAGSAGAANIVVTNSAGASSALSYTRGA